MSYQKNMICVIVAVNGGKATLKKPNIVGMIIPNAIKSAVITIFFVLSLFAILKSRPYVKFC